MQPGPVGSIGGVVSFGSGEVSARQDEPSKAQYQPGQLQISIGACGSIPILELAGEIDMSSAPLLREKYDAIRSQSDAGLVVDLSGVAFLDSSGLAALVSLHQELQERGSQLRVLAPTPAIRRLFDITGLTSLFEIEPLGPEET
jgi:anti-sigma B factor antagonist